eukprot:778716-Alexandrium_andersonii.AAC.1
MQEGAVLGSACALVGAIKRFQTLAEGAYTVPRSAPQLRTAASNWITLHRASVGGILLPEAVLCSSRRP